eukprot:gene24318-32755_t
MERLVQHLKAMITQCANFPPNPTVQQLEKKTAEMNATLDIDSAPLPQQIKEIISSGFQLMGWDAVNKKISQKPLFTFDGLKNALQKIFEQVENWSPVIIPTQEELASLSSACNKLWDLDFNRLSPGRDYVLNPQEGKSQWDGADVAPDPLFVFVDEKALERPTFKSFIAIFDNYIANTGQTEVVTSEERQENQRFLNFAMDTAVMQYVHKYLLATGKTRSATRNQFIAELNEIWFGLYSRKTRNDSSGFEHVFLGEITEKKDGAREVVGMHNWIQLYMQERMKKLDYRGWIKPKRKGLHHSAPSEHEQLITIQFLWNGQLKPVSTTLVGTSPEFEIALYTLCFYQQEKADNDVILGPYRVRVTCHTWDQQGKKYIATSYPSEAP